MLCAPIAGYVALEPLPPAQIAYRIAVGITVVENAVRRVVARARFLLRGWSLVWEVAPAPASLVRHAPVDTAHWLPNMPRGHEDSERGGVRDTNADV